MEQELSIVSERIDDVVLLLNVMIQMELPQILNDHLSRHWKQKGLDWGWVIVIWLSFILSECDHRKVVVRNWVEQRRQMLSQVCDLEISPTDFSDDRLAIVLKHLSHDEIWQSIERVLNDRTVSIYELPLEQVRLDATTVSGEHLVTEDGIFQFGHSKDDPSVPQIKTMMADLDPLGLPLATHVVSGERADDGLYIPVFEQVRAGLPQKPLLWIGDCKMGALGIRSHIHEHDHYYLAPLARIGHVPELLNEWLAELQEKPERLHHVLLPRGDGTYSSEVEGYELCRGVEGKTEQGWGVCWQERVFLVYSSTYQQQQQRGLETRLQKASEKLITLTPPVGRGRRQIRQQDILEKKAQAILNSHRVSELLHYTFEFEPHNKTHKERYQITGVTRNQMAIASVEQSLGWRVYVTNAPAQRLSFEQGVVAYRQEWRVERGFHRLKGKPLGASPLFVQREDQVQGLMHLLSLGLRLLTLIEFVVRRQLEKTQQALSGLYQGSPHKTTSQPTTERILKAFENITLSFVDIGGKIYRHLSPLSALQEKILSLLGLSSQIYISLIRGSG